MTMYKALALSALLGLVLVRSAAAQCVPACGPCEVCDVGTSTCVVPDTLGCQAPPTHKSSLTVKKGLVASNDLVVWKWLSSLPVPVEDFGDPLLDDDYTLCMFDAAGGGRRLLVSATTPAGSHCHGGACWTQGSFGWRYVDKLSNYGGFLRMQLRPGDANRARVFVKADGAKLALTGPVYTAPVTIRLLRSGAPTCWEATFPIPLANYPSKFTARSE